MENTEQLCLKYLKQISYCCTEKNSIGDSGYFLEMYNNALKLLAEYADKEENQYIKKTLAKMPELDIEKVNNFKKESNGGGVVMGFSLIGAIIGIISLFYSIQKDKGSSSDLSTLKGYCDHMIFAIENPMFAE